jgi:hypothetical protein
MGADGAKDSVFGKIRSADNKVDLRGLPLRVI